MAAGATMKLLDHRQDGAVVREIRLAAPKGPNVFSRALIASLSRALDDAVAAPAVAALVISHEGRAFCAGTDLAELLDLHREPASLRAFLASLVQLLRAVEGCRIPTIAAVDGAAVGGGFELALACDIRIMAPAAWIALPETGLGTIPGGGGVQALTRFVGRSRALDMILTGRRLSAADCADAGLARLAGGGSAREDALDLARRLAQGPAHALSAAKAIVLGSETMAAEELDRMALEGMVATLTGPEGTEGLRAVAGKRAPDFIRARGASRC